MPDNELEEFREAELLPLVQELLPTVLGAVEVFREPIIDGSSFLRKLRPDFMALLGDGRMAIIEVKGVTPNTRPRLEDAVYQLALYRDAYKEANPTRSVVLALVTPG